MSTNTFQKGQDTLGKMDLRAWMTAGVLVAAAILLALAAFQAWQVSRIPFPGLFVEPTLLTNQIGYPDWAGFASGIRVHDRVLALDGHRLSGTTALVQALAGRQPGDLVTLTVQAAGESSRDVRLRLTPLPIRVLTDFFVLPYALGIIYWSVGTWIFLARRHQEVGQVFALMCTAIALSLGLLFDTYTSHQFPQVWIAALSLIGSVLTHLALVFPQKTRFLNRVPSLCFLAYLPGALIAFINQFTVLNDAMPRAYFSTWLLAFLFASFGVFVFLAMMAYRGLRSQSPIVQAQARTIFWGSILAFGPIAFWFVAFAFIGWGLSTVLILPWLILFPVSIGYTILRYRLFDVNVVISRGVGYALLCAVVAGVYFLFIYPVSLALNIPMQAIDHLLVLTFGLGTFLLASLLDPARTRLQHAVDRVLLRDTVDHRKIVSHFSDRLTAATDLSSILEVLEEALASGWQLQFSALFLLDSQQGRYVPHTIAGNLPAPVTFDRQGPLARHLLQRRESLFLYQDRPLPDHLLEEQEEVAPLSASLFVPIPGRGWLVLGPKRSGAPFSSEDWSTLESMGSHLAVALEKARLFTDLEQRMTEVDVLRWVGQAVNFTMDVDDLMELVYAQTSRVLDATNFYIALYDQTKKTLSFAFHVENGERTYPKEEWSVDNGLTGEIVRLGRPIVTENYEEECRQRGIEPFRQTDRAWMGAPLNAGNRVIGVMNVSSVDPTMRYTEEQRQIFSAIADQAAAILDKARLYREMEERAQQLAALNEVGSVITSTLDLKVVLKLIMDKAVDLLRVEAGSLILVDQDTGELIFEVTTGPGSADLEGARLPPGTGVVGTVVEENRPIVIRDAQRDERWYQDLDADFITHSIIAAPMSSRGRAIGVIELLNRRDGVPFDDDDEQLLMAFAANAAVAIENARLFTQTDQALAERVEELSMMQRIDRELNATLDYGRVMNLTLDWALRMTGADVGLLAVVVETEDGVRGLRFLANKGYPDHLVAGQEKDPWPLDQGVIGRVVRTGISVLVEDVAQDADYTPVLPNMVAQMTVPIRCEEQIVGVIALESEQAGRLNPDGLEFVIRLADHAAIAIENARLFEQLRRANDAKTEFVSFVSHELKQPMTSIKGYTDLLAKGTGGELNEAQLSFLQTIRLNVSRMSTLVSDLLDISRIESGRLKLDVGEVHMSDVVDDAMRTTRQQIEAKEQTVEVDVEPGLPPVKGDRNRLVQVLTNMVSNAHKYTPEGGTIIVQARRYGGHQDAGPAGFVLCSVIDTGIGISAEDQERLFTKYFRSTDPAVRDVAGTGLGLVITKSLVELQGGDIWVESEVGQGSTFSFTVPAIAQ